MLDLVAIQIEANTCAEDTEGRVCERRMAQIIRDLCDEVEKLRSEVDRKKLFMDASDKVFDVAMRGLTGLSSALEKIRATRFGTNDGDEGWMVEWDDFNSEAERPRTAVFRTEKESLDFAKSLLDGPAPPDVVLGAGFKVKEDPDRWPFVSLKTFSPSWSLSRSGVERHATNPES